MNSTFRDVYMSDLKRYGTKPISPKMKRFHYYLRHAQTERNTVLRCYWRYRYRRIREKMHIELFPSTQIGKGLYIGHPYGITVNADAQIGANVNLHKGVTIGQENRGLRKGAPTIGNCVWIGINATVVGKITIGDDVLIAPNSYVNCNVPSHSVVFGNPCVIKHRENATEHYVNSIRGSDA